MSNPISIRRTCPAATSMLVYLFLGAASAGCATEEFGELNEDEEGEAGDVTSTGLASPYDFQPIAPCLSRRDYASRGVVQFGFGRDPFTPPCVRLATGGTVVFQGLFQEHPLVPRPLGTTPSPIVATDSGGGVEFEFYDFGFFPYQCSRHPEEIGVIWASSAY